MQNLILTSISAVSLSAIVAWAFGYNIDLNASMGLELDTLGIIYILLFVFWAGATALVIKMTQ